MFPPNYSADRFPEARPDSADPYAAQLALSHVHARLVPMRRVRGEYEVAPGAEGWCELPAARGLAGYGLGRALRMLLDVLRGLTALHDTCAASGEPFAHGEVALTQFRVDPEGVCRLVPLTSRHAAGGEEQPSAAVLGHLAPERLLGEALDARADVFSAGILLWEALAGRRLFEETTPEAIIDRLMAEELHMPQLPPELVWAIPLKWVAARALALTPQQRFSDCAELATAIAIVARERLATHAEVANFFRTPARSTERRTLGSVRASALAPAMTPASIVPSSGPRSQRDSTKRSPDAAPGPASSRPGAPEVARSTAPAAAAADPDFTPEPRAVHSSSMLPLAARGAHRSPFSALLMPPLDLAPDVPAHAKAVPYVEAERSTQLVPTAPRCSEAPRSARLPPPLPAYAQIPSFPAVAVEPVLSSKSTFSAVVVPLPLIAEEDLLDANVASRRAPARTLWTVLAVSSLGGALAVTALARGPSPSSAPVVTIAAAQLAQARLSSNGSEHARRPRLATASSGNAAASSSGKASNAPSAAHLSRGLTPGKAQSGRKDYGI